MIATGLYGRFSCQEPLSPINSCLLNPFHHNCRTHSPHNKCSPRNKIEKVRKLANCVLEPNGPILNQNLQGEFCSGPNFGTFCLKEPSLAGEFGVCLVGSMLVTRRRAGKVALAEPGAEVGAQTLYCSVQTLLEPKHAPMTRPCALAACPPGRQCSPPGISPRRPLPPK